MVMTKTVSQKPTESIISKENILEIPIGKKQKLVSKYVWYLNNARRVVNKSITFSLDEMVRWKNDCNDAIISSSKTFEFGMCNTENNIISTKIVCVTEQTE